MLLWSPQILTINGVQTMSPKWRFFFLGYFISLPNTLVGLIIALFYRSHSLRWSDGCLEVITEHMVPADAYAQTHGWLIIYSSTDARRYPDIRAHERVHVVQYFLFGPLFWLVYGLCHLVGWIKSGKFWGGYTFNYLENQAYEREQTKGAWGL